MKSKKKNSRIKEDPTLEEIRRRCKKIRSAWTDRERFKRSGMERTQWLPPTVPMDDSLEGVVFLDPERN